MTGTFALLQLVTDRVKTPVVAAGGIANGRGIAGALTLGAEGVQVGTAFLACNESGASPMHKQMLFSDAAKDTILSRAFTGRLGRGITSKLAKDLAERESKFLPFPLQSAFMSSLRKAAIDRQKWEMIHFWSGQIAPILKHRQAPELMRSLIAETTYLLKEKKT
jgi:nitronate monooxygenase